MNQIKFSHNYPKIWNQKKAQLIYVTVMNRESINEDLKEYDTKTIKGDYYELKGDRFLQLTFIGDKLIPFCTIRPYNESKREYYESSIGKIFEIIITENK